MKTTALSISIVMLFTSSFSQVNVVDSFYVAHDNPGVEQTINGSFDFFASDELLQMTLCFDIRKFIKTKSNPEYLNATLMVKLGDSDSVKQNIKVKARGEMRRTYCQFPPIMLKFKRNQDNTGIMHNGGTIKLVTHCMRSSFYDKFLLKEYLTYKLFNQVTPYSYKTRLVKVTYVDINKPEKAFTSFGFLIESEEKMAERNGSVIINNDKLTQKHMNSVDMARIAVFNYMIGNTDWSVPLRHNISIIKPLDVISDKGVPVAYDFDYSGIVNTTYAVPNEQLPIKDVKDRYYLGVCYTEEELKPVLDEFGSLQEELSGTINSFEFLQVQDKKAVEAYLDSFYKMYRWQNVLQHDLNKTCKQF